MSVSRSFTSDEAESHEPRLRPSVKMRCGLWSEAIESGSYSSSITSASNDGRSTYYSMPTEASSDRLNTKPLPGIVERPQGLRQSRSSVCRDPPAKESRGHTKRFGENQAPKEDGMSAIRKDDMFYMKSLYLKVEGKLFSVPRSSLELKSASIKDVLSKSSDTGPGSSSSNPLILIGMTVGEFRHFLDALSISTCSEDLYRELQQEHWVDVLKVSFLLKSEQFHKLAITQLENSLSEPVTRVELAIKYGVPKWRTTGYQALAIAAEPLNVDEAERIGWENALKISNIRDTRLLKRITITHKLSDQNTSSRCEKSQLHEKLFPASPPQALLQEMVKLFEDVFGAGEGPAKLPSGEPTPDADSTSPVSTKWQKLYEISFVVFKVDNILFRVPQHIFTEPSSTFTTMYTLPREGEEDNNPVVLRDVNADDFRAFLECALRTISGQERVDLWLSAIKVSDLWHLTRVRNFAVSKLEQSETDLTARIALSLSHNIPEWFRPNMLSLALRRKAPEKREAEQIGWENTIRLFQLREKLCPFRMKILAKAMVTANRGYSSSIIVWCPMCTSDVNDWKWVAVDDNAEAQDAKEAISEAFPADNAAVRPTKKRGRASVKSQPLRRLPISSTRRRASSV